MQTVDEIVEEQLRASKKLREKLLKDKKLAREFLIKIGALSKKGTGPRRRHK